MQKIKKSVLINFFFGPSFFSSAALTNHEGMKWVKPPNRLPWLRLAILCKYCLPFSVLQYVETALYGSNMPHFTISSLIPNKLISVCIYVIIFWLYVRECMRVCACSCSCSYVYLRVCMFECYIFLSTSITTPLFNSTDLSCCISLSL